MNIYNTITKELLEDKYFKQNLTMQAIAEELKVSYKFIFYKMRAFNIKSKPKFNDLTGQTFTYLKVLNKDEQRSNDGQSFWICKCKCGIVKSVSAKKLKIGDAKSCGCLRMIKIGCGKNNISWRGYEDIPKSIFTQIKNNAQIRHIPFDLTIEQMWNLFVRQGKKCIYSGQSLTFNTSSTRRDGTASLDRIDSSKGYVEKNVQWIHKEINYMKMDLSEDKFLNWIELIHQHQKK